MAVLHLHLTTWVSELPGHRSGIGSGRESSRVGGRQPRGNSGPKGGGGDSYPIPLSHLEALMGLLGSATAIELIRAWQGTILGKRTDVPSPHGDLQLPPSPPGIQQWLF